MPHQALEVRQESYVKRAFSIIDPAGEIHGTLTYQKGIHDSAIATYDGHEWTFTAHGIINDSVEIEDAQTGKHRPEVYRKPLFTTAGMIELDGQKYRFKPRRSGLLKSHYEWLTADDQPVIHYANRGFLKTAGEITIEDTVPQNVASLLTVLGLFISFNTDNATASAAAM